MFRSIVSIVLIFSVTLANFSRLFIYAGFEMNQEYIVTELCENKDAPELNCNGQCYLSKKLKQADEKEPQQEKASQKMHFQEAFLTEKVLVELPVQFIKTFPMKEYSFILSQHPFVIFHPPKRVA